MNLVQLIQSLSQWTDCVLLHKHCSLHSFCSVEITPCWY